MKLTLSTNEVQEAVAQFIIANGFPIDMNHAEIESNDDGSVTVTIVAEETKEQPKAVRKPKKKETTEPVEKAHETVEETNTEEQTQGKDVFIEQLDEVTELEPVEDTSHEKTRKLFG